MYKIESEPWDTLPILIGIILNNNCLLLKSGPLDKSDKKVSTT